MAKWDSAFATTVRQYLTLEGWVLLIDGLDDVDRSITWLRSEVELSLSKKVVDRIGQLDRSRDRGMYRAVSLMKGLRTGKAPRILCQAVAYIALWYFLYRKYAANGPGPNHCKSNQLDPAAWTSFYDHQKAHLPSAHSVACSSSSHHRCLSFSYQGSQRPTIRLRCRPYPHARVSATSVYLE